MLLIMLILTSPPHLSHYASSNPCLYFDSLEAMQCPDVVVANLDTNSFSSKQTVHVNEVLFVD